MLLKRLAFLVIFAAILLGRGARRERLVARLDRTAGSAREAANFFFGVFERARTVRVQRTEHRVHIGVAEAKVRYARA